MRDRRRTCEDRRHRKESIPMSIPLAYAAVAARRNPPALPFGWGAVTVLLVGALFTIIGIVIILYVIGGVLAGIGGWLIRLWWIFLLVGVVAGTAGNTARDREAARTSEVRVRCQSCGRLNPEFVKFCMSCGKPV